MRFTFVVVPADKLNELITECDTCLSIEGGGVMVSNEIGRTG